MCNFISMSIHSTGLLATYAELHLFYLHNPRLHELSVKPPAFILKLQTLQARVVQSTETDVPCAADIYLQIK